MYGDNNDQSLHWINGVPVYYSPWSTSQTISWGQPGSTSKCVALDSNDNYNFVEHRCTDGLPYLCTGES